MWITVRRCMIVIGLATLLPCTGPATAQDRPPGSGAAESERIQADVTEAADTPAPSITDRLKNFDLVETDAREVAALLAQAIRRKGYRCSWVSDFQLVRVYADLRSFKAKCPGQPLYGIRVSVDGELWVMGGEFMVSGLGPGDGEIISFAFAPGDTPPKAPSIEEMTDVPRAGEDRSRPSPVLQTRSGRVRSGMRAPDWLLTSLIINGMAAAFLIVFAVAVFRRGSRQRTEIAHRFARMTSHDKDAVIEESEPVGPRIYRHPDGIYIARGQRGRRRFFSRKLGAILYRDLGSRIFEIT